MGDPEEPPQWLKQGVEKPVSEQRIPWDPASWRHGLGDHDSTVARLEAESGQQKGEDQPRLARDPVHRIAGEGDPVALLVASMVWGFGPIGYGPWRTREMLDTPGALGQLEELARATRKDGAVVAYARLRNRKQRPKWLGPAFGTKFLHFAGWRSGSGGLRPLVLDANVVAGLRHAGIDDMTGGGWSAGQYERYLRLAHSWAERLDVEADEVEYALFRKGREPAQSARGYRC